MTDQPDFRKTLAAAQRGDQQALDALFAQFYFRVQSMVHQSLAADFRAKRPWLGAMFSTGDVVQEVFLNVLRGIEDFQGSSEGEFVSYLTTLTRNRLVDAVRFHEAVRRDRRRVQSGDEQLLADRAHEPADPLITRDELARYTTALADFRERERALLRSRLEADGDPRPFEELARELGYPSAGAARKAFFMSKAKLLVRLGVSKGS